MSNNMVEKAENFTNQYVWENEFSRQIFIKTLVIQGETIQAVKERWQNTGDADQDGNPGSNSKYREVIDTVNAHYMAILTDLLNSASPISETAE